MDNIKEQKDKKEEQINEKSEDSKTEILKKAAKQYFNSAEDEFNKKRYNSAVVLYFKSLVAFVDLFVFPNSKIKTGSLLLIRLDSIGDYVLFRNFIRELKTSEKYKNHHITLLGNASWKAVAEKLDAEKNIIAEQIKTQGKPPQVVEKIVSGKLNKYYSEVCLVDQPFVKDPNMKVGDLIAQVSQKSGKSLTVRSFVRFRIGE